MWQFRKADVHIGIYNSHASNEPVTFEIKMREQSTHECLSDEYREKNEVFNFVHQGTDAHLASDAERSEKNLHGQTEFIYGEVLF